MGGIVSYNNKKVVKVIINRLFGEYDKEIFNYIGKTIKDENGKKIITREIWKILNDGFKYRYFETIYVINMIIIYFDNYKIESYGVIIYENEIDNIIIYASCVFKENKLKYDKKIFMINMDKNNNILEIKDILLFNTSKIQLSDENYEIIHNVFNGECIIYTMNNNISELLQYDNGIMIGNKYM